MTVNKRFTAVNYIRKVLKSVHEVTYGIIVTKYKTAKN